MPFGLLSPVLCRIKSGETRSCQILFFLAAVILLLSGGLIAGLYIALRPDHAIRPPTPWEGRAVLPCPKMGGMNEEYTEDTCRKQSRQEFITTTRQSCKNNDIYNVTTQTSKNTLVRINGFYNREFCTFG